MTFLNAEDSWPEDLRSDVCLVGSGIMGLALTQHLLANSKAHIVLIEQGPLEDTEALSAVPEERNSGDLVSGVAASRAKGFGGSSRRWGGQALPFFPQDLDDRPFLKLRDPWPLKLADLAPHYKQASAFDANLWNSPLFDQAFGPAKTLELNFSKWSPVAYLADRYRPIIAASPRVTCIYNARVTAVHLNREGNKVEGVRVRCGNGQGALLLSPLVVLCGGGIENPRLLLASPQGDRQGIGNDHDLVGRFYQDHIGFYAARLEPLNWRLFEHLFAAFLNGNQKFLPKLQLSQATQKSQELLNVTGNIEIQESELAPRQAARRIYRRLSGLRRQDSSLIADGKLLLKAPASAFQIARSYLRGRLHVPKEARYFLIANAESEPLHDSRILLDSSVDSDGQPRALVHWRCSDRTLMTLRTYVSGLRDTLEQTGIAKVFPSTYLTESNLDWKKRTYSIYHHMGATRMAVSARQGVVDPNGQVFGVANLYVAGTSVLPTGSASNPSFTALALTLRLGDHLLRQLPQS
jgi:choline dehydrogenase-like flavoprotein